MVLTFDHCPGNYEIQGIQYQLDEQGIPVDINIWANKDILEAIAEFCSIGWNIQELDEYEALKYSCTHEALYARLHPFTINGASRVVYFN